MTNRKGWAGAVVVLAIGAETTSGCVDGPTCQDLLDPRCVCPDDARSGCAAYAEAGPGASEEGTAPDAGQDASLEGSDALAPEGSVAVETGAACASAGQTLCSGTCVDTSADLRNCGGCGNVCPTPPSHGTPLCAAATDGGGACGVSCATGFHPCGNACFSNTDSPSATGDSCVVDEAYGVFVSAAAGTDLNPGTRAAPVQTLGRGMDLAEASGKSVYACAATYPEHLVLDAGRDGLRLFGGFACATWAYQPGLARATVAPITVGYALRIAGLTQGVNIEDTDFQSQSTITPGTSSIAIHIAGSRGVVLLRSQISAGMGVAGLDAAAAAAASNVAPDGQAGAGATPGVQTVNPQCPMSLGGAGAAQTKGGAPGAPGQPGPANGNTPMDCTNSILDNAGATGAVGTDGPGAASLGVLSAAGWTGSPGHGGAPGAAGQGGGGGANVGLLFVAGASGGAGGCGGSAGDPGGAGGASVAVTIYNSVVDFETCAFSSGNAGAGGRGATGAPGQLGGMGGSGAGQCAGGNGGPGGSGGAGGGGAGGVSAGIVWSITAPLVDGTRVSGDGGVLTNITLGSPGAAGMGGSATNGGVAGVAAPVLME